MNWKTNPIIKKINYNGFCNLEFKWDTKKRQFLFIEINPRLPVYNSLFHASGVNFPYVAFLDQKYNNADLICNSQQRERVRRMNFRCDFASYIRRREIDNKVSAMNWLQSVIRENSCAYWNKKDPYPFKKSTLDFISLIVLKMLRIRSVRGRDSGANLS